MLNIVLRILTLILLFSRDLYWRVAGKKTQQNKPKTARRLTFIEKASVVVSYFLFIFTVLQVAGLSLFPINGNTLVIQVVGTVLVGLGTVICFVARKALADNWVSGEEYQIKQNQELVTSGIYAYMRHPIYTGLALSFIGAEMVAQSYLFLSLFAYFVVAYVQGKREEKILLSHFGGKYKQYMSQTRMFIPFLW